jgi:hypothetical protein
VPTRLIAEAIGASLGLPVQSISAHLALDHFGWIGRFFGIGGAASNTLTRQRFAWEPSHPGLIEDITNGAYLEPVETH